MANIAAEFGGSTPHSLSEYYGVAAGIPSSGTISMNQFYGTSNAQYPYGEDILLLVVVQLTLVTQEILLVQQLYTT